VKNLIALVPLIFSCTAWPQQCVNNAGDAPGNLPLNTGMLVWHSYVSYDDGSSQLWMRNIAAGSTANISASWACAKGCTVRDPMNASFSPNGQWILFMGVSNNAWNIWVVPTAGGSPTNLTKSRGASSRNEDPKWSSDGKYIIWKLNSGNDVEAAFTGGASPSIGTVTAITNGKDEKSMPFVDSTFSNIYFADGAASPLVLKEYNIAAGTTNVLSTNAYYPIVRWSDNTVFWTDDTHEGANDQIVYLPVGGTSILANINDCDADNSDPWPVSGTTYVFFTSTSPGSYQLYLGDLSTGNRYNISNWYTDTAKSHLGPSYWVQ
jgi:Tol biopolymer transport system component